PAISSATTSVKNPPLRAPYGRLRMPAPMLAPKMIATPCQNVIDSKPSPFDALVCSDMVLLSRAPESARSVNAGRAGQAAPAAGSSLWDDDAERRVLPK